MAALTARELLAVRILQGMHACKVEHDTKAQEQLARSAINQADILMGMLGIHEEHETGDEQILRLEAQVNQLIALLRSVRSLLPEDYQDHVEAVLEGIDISRKARERSSTSMI
jgi:hypothetical protein